MHLKEKKIKAILIVCHETVGMAELEQVYSIYLEFFPLFLEKHALLCLPKKRFFPAVTVELSAKSGN